MTTKTLSKDQIKNLLLNAYGFANDEGMIYCCHESMFMDNDFGLAAPDDDYLLFTYEGATFNNGTACFVDTNGTVHRFTVLIAAVQGVSENGQSIEEYLLN